MDAATGDSHRPTDGWIAPNITFGFLHILYVETRLKIGIKGSRRIGLLDRGVSCYKVTRRCIPNMK